MGKIAYRFIPCDDDETPREGSQLMLVSAARIAVGSLVEEDLFCCSVWEVVAVRAEDQLFRGAHDERGNEIPLGAATISFLCRPNTRAKRHATGAQRRHSTTHGTASPARRAR